jgi:hypothetical protein
VDRLGEGGLVSRGEFGDGLLGARVIDQGLAAAGGGDKGGGVERARQAGGVAVQSGGGVVGQQRSAGLRLLVSTRPPGRQRRRVRPPAARGSAFPQLRLVALGECGSHGMFAAAMGATR